MTIPTAVNSPSVAPRLAGHLLVEALLAQGVDTVFGVPGESYLAVLDGFHEHREKIRFIACRQEGGAAFMAEAQGTDHRVAGGRQAVAIATQHEQPQLKQATIKRRLEQVAKRIFMEMYIITAQLYQHGVH